MSYSAQPSLSDFYQTLSLQERHSYAFVEMNIKYFSYYNARFGHDYGDELLHLIQHILETFLKNRGIVQHVYGDTFHFFIVCSEDPSRSDDENVLQGFLSELVDYLFDNHDRHAHQNIFMSFGILLPHSVYGSYDDLLMKVRFARKNCPQLKHRTYSYEIFSDDNYFNYLAQQDLAKQLTNARKNNEFEIFVQPKVDPRTEKIVAGEVLMRWNHSNGIPLNKYISVLQKYTEIYLVDFALFQKACAYLKEGLTRNEPRVPLSFNVSEVAVCDQNFCSDYFSVISEFGIPPEYLEFEFLEDIKLQQDANVRNVLKQFQEKGMTCSLDDFGAGNSSFAFLLQGGIDCIKLDRIFFQGELTESRKQVLYHLLKIADATNVKVVAEGVEDRTYIDFLKQTNCFAVQGFYYYPPMPLSEFQTLLNYQSKHAPELIPGTLLPHSDTP